MKNSSHSKSIRFISLIFAIIFVLTVCSGCGNSTSDDNSSSNSQETSASSSGTEETVTLKGIADLTPHSELIEYVAPKLEEQGITIELVSTAADATTNEKLNNGEIDFNFFQHEPYLLSEVETNGYDLISAGAIHVEPITAYSDKYDSVDDIPDGAVVAIPSDGTNEYRALKILEDNGFIKLDEAVSYTLSASVKDIIENKKNLEIVELDSAQIIPTKDDYDFFITNTNKVLEANITSTKLFAESGKDNPYANIITIRSEDKDNEAIKALVEALQSEDTQKYIEETYNGAVIPVEYRLNTLVA